VLASWRILFDGQQAQYHIAGVSMLGMVLLLSLLSILWISHFL